MLPERDISSEAALISHRLHSLSDLGSEACNRSFFSKWRTGDKRIISAAPNINMFLIKDSLRCI